MPKGKGYYPVKKTKKGSKKSSGKAALMQGYTKR